MFSYVKMALCIVTGSKVLECTSSVAQQAEPIVKNATETAAKIKDLSEKATAIISTCIPASASVVTAIPCLAVSTAAVLSDVAKDIVIIKTDVSNIIDDAPALKQEIQSCAAEVKTASANVDQLTDEIKKCVDDYVSSSAA
jgi:cell division protein FtsB